MAYLISQEQIPLIFHEKQTAFPSFISQALSVVRFAVSDDNIVAVQNIKNSLVHFHTLDPSLFVVVLTKDPNAEIFKFANIGITGDAKPVFKAIVDELEALKV